MLHLKNMYSQRMNQKYQMKKMNRKYESIKKYEENVREMKAVKNNAVVNALNKTKEERFPDLYREQQDREREVIREKKEKKRAEDNARKAAALEAKKKKEEMSYDRIMKGDMMTSNAETKATADSTAAEEYEDDFF